MISVWELLREIILLHWGSDGLKVFQKAKCLFFWCVSLRGLGLSLEGKGIKRENFQTNTGFSSPSSHAIGVKALIIQFQMNFHRCFMVNRFNRVHLFMERASCQQEWQGDPSCCRKLFSQSTFRRLFAWVKVYFLFIWCCYLNNESVNGCSGRLNQN